MYPLWIMVIVHCHLSFQGGVVVGRCLKTFEGQALNVRGPFWVGFRECSSWKIHGHDAQCETLATLEAAQNKRFSWNDGEARKPIFGNHLNDLQFDGAPAWHFCFGMIARFKSLLITSQFALSLIHFEIQQTVKCPSVLGFERLQHTMNQHCKSTNHKPIRSVFIISNHTKKIQPKNQNIAASSSSPLQVFCTSIIRLPK